MTSGFSDYTRRSGNYLMAVGVVQVLSLNLAGILMIWFATQIKRYRPGFRIAAIAVLSIYVAMGVGVGLYAAIAGTMNTQLQIQFLAGVEHPPLLAVWALAAVMIAIFGLPLYWLAAPGTRNAFVQRAAGAVRLCRGCQYNLYGVTGDRCPECGKVIPGRKTATVDA